VKICPKGPDGSSLTYDTGQMGNAASHIADIGQHVGAPVVRTRWISTRWFGIRRNQTEIPVINTAANTVSLAE